MQILDKFTSSQITKERIIFQVQITLISKSHYIARLMNLNKIKETQDPKNTNGNIGTTLQVGFIKRCFKSLHQPTIINAIFDKLNASLL